MAELEAVISRENDVFLKASEDQKVRFEETEQRIKAMIAEAQNDQSANRDKIITDLHEVRSCRSIPYPRALILRCCPFRAYGLVLYWCSDGVIHRLISCVDGFDVSMR